MRLYHPVFGTPDTSVRRRYLRDDKLHVSGTTRGSNWDSSLSSAMLMIVNADLIPRQRS